MAEAYEGAAEIMRRLRDVNNEVGDLIGRLGSSPSVSEYLEARARIGRLQAQFDHLNNLLSAELGVGSAKARILAYLQLHVGEIVAKEELAGVAGIFEFQRRIRELRNDEGWPISTMETRADLRPGEYVLSSLERDLGLKSDWETARQIRVSGRPPEDLLLEFLMAIHPRPADEELLRFVTGVAALGELIDATRARGWAVVGRGDDAALAPGEFRLVLPTEPEAAH